MYSNGTGTEKEKQKYSGKEWHLFLNFREVMAKDVISILVQFHAYSCMLQPYVHVGTNFLSRLNVGHRKRPKPFISMHLLRFKIEYLISYISVTLPPVRYSAVSTTVYMNRYERLADPDAGRNNHCVRCKGGRRRKDR